MVLGFRVEGFGFRILVWGFGSWGFEVLVFSGLGLRV